VNDGSAHLDEQLVQRVYVLAFARAQADVVQAAALLIKAIAVNIT